MPKPFLECDQATLERDLIETMIAGLHEWRSDLSYHESHSDMQGCVRALLRMYNVKRRPVALPLRLQCTLCDGAKQFVRLENSVRHITTCDKCGGRGYTLGE